MPVIRMSDPAHFAHRPRPERLVKSSRIGDRLKNIILRKTTRGVPCSDCASEITRMNAMTREEVLAEADDIALRIVKRAETKAHKWYERAAAKYMPGFVKAEVRRWIEEACEETTEAKRPS